METDQRERENFNRLRRAHDREPIGSAIHLAVPDLVDACYLKLAEEICRVADGYNVGIRLTVTRRDRNREAEAAAVCDVSDGIGLILLSDGKIHSQIGARGRVVGVGGIEDGHEFPTISSGRPQAMDVLLEHLVTLGHSKIHFIHTGLPYSRVETRRQFLHVAGRHGIAAEVGFAELGGTDSLLGFVTAAEAGDATAFVVGDDAIAVHLVDELRRHGVDVPLGTSVAGIGLCNGTPVSAALTTVDHRVNAIAHAAVDAIIRDREPDRTDFAPRLVLGATTGYAPRRLR